MKALKASKGTKNIDENFQEFALDKVSKKDLMEKYGYSPEEAGNIVARRALRTNKKMGGKINTKEQADQILKDYTHGGDNREGTKRDDSIAKLAPKFLGFLSASHSRKSTERSKVRQTLGEIGVKRVEDQGGGRLVESGTVITKSKNQNMVEGEEVKEENAQKIVDEITALKKEQNSKKSVEDKAKIQNQIEIRDKKLQNHYVDTQVMAHRKIKREETEGAVKNILGGNIKLDSARHRENAMSKLRDKLKGAGEDEKAKIQRAIDALGQNEVFYSTDSRSAPNSSRPMLFRRGTLTVGQPYDQVDMYDPNQSGGGGGGLAPIINIYGGDEKKIYDVVLRAMKAQG